MEDLCHRYNVLVHTAASNAVNTLNGDRPSLQTLLNLGRLCFSIPKAPRKRIRSAVLAIGMPQALGKKPITSTFAAQPRMELESIPFEGAMYFAITATRCCLGSLAFLLMNQGLLSPLFDRCYGMRWQRGKVTGKCLLYLPHVRHAIGECIEEATQTKTSFKHPNKPTKESIAALVNWYPADVAAYYTTEVGIPLPQSKLIMEAAGMGLWQRYHGLYTVPFHAQLGWSQAVTFPLIADDPRTETLFLQALAAMMQMDGLGLALENVAGLLVPSNVDKGTSGTTRARILTKGERFMGKDISKSTWIMLRLTPLALDPMYICIPHYGVLLCWQLHYHTLFQEKADSHRKWILELATMWIDQVKNAPVHELFGDLRERKKVFLNTQTPAERYTVLLEGICIWASQRRIPYFLDRDDAMRWLAGQPAEKIIPAPY
jgi:hypothetical protein